ncbi:uncharacterized protein LOC125202551 [Salvia hispanica]|uniref:uncharacterized protein LOC125202551 n=1 Tax=Salvia hispanica TaxID=49212 RepID=UPI00200991AF|nr:uncharacterized protein LOC125202551 [Salvia hispanica]
MSVPGNAERSLSFSSSIPIKKRRIPVFQPCSPPREENPPALEDCGSKQKEESKGQDGGGMPSSEAMKSDSLVNSVKKEVDPVKLANVDVAASKPVEAKPGSSLGLPDDSGNKKVVEQSERSSAHVKQEIVGGQIEGTFGLQRSTEKMNVELSLGPQESVVHASEHQQKEVNIRKSDKVESLLSLALHEEKLVSRDKKDIAADSSNPVSANRSNWDLNTTMDVWEGSTCSDAFTQGLGNIGGFNKSDSHRDDKSLLTMASLTRPGYNKGKHILDGHTSSSFKLLSPQQRKVDDSLGLRLAMPFMDTSSVRSSLSDNLDLTSASPNLSSKQVQLPIVNVSRAVKTEPIDDNSKRDCSIGSSSSTNMESSKFSSVKRECAINHSLQTILQSSPSLEKIDDRIPIKSEVVQDYKQEVCKSIDAATPPVTRVMQHQDSCASSSAMPVSLLPQSISPARLTTCSEVTTNRDILNQSEQSIHSKESQSSDNKPDEPNAMPIRKDNNQLRTSQLGSSSVVDEGKCALARIDEHAVESFQNDNTSENGEVDMDISNDTREENSSGSDTDTESAHIRAAGTVRQKEDEEYEDGEVREHLQHAAEGAPIVEGKGNDDLKLVAFDSQNLQPGDPSVSQSMSTSVFKEKEDVEENIDGTQAEPTNDQVGACCEPDIEDNSLHESYEMSEVVAEEKRATSVTLDGQLDMSVEDMLERQVSSDIPTDQSHGIDVGIGGEAKVVRENCMHEGEGDLTLSDVGACLDGHDAAKDSNNASNKSRIINLSRPSVMSAPFKTKHYSNRSQTTRSGKERYSDFDGEMQPRGNSRDEFYTGGSNKFVKDRAYDQSVRNSRPNFMRGKGRTGGRFGSFRREWDSDHNFAPESSYGQSDYRVIRRKHASSISDADLEHGGYNIPQDNTSFGGNRRKTMNDEFSSLRRASLRRVSSGDRDGPVARGFQMIHRIPRNSSPRRSSGEAGSNMMGLQNDEKFMQHLSDDVGNPVYAQPQALYEELDNQLVRGNRNFSTTLQRKGYPRIRSKSPVRSRTRSPGPWSSPRRRSPNGLQELVQHQSPALYRMGRMRSPDHGCFHDDMVARRRGSPSYVARHNNDMREVDSGREHIHPRTTDSNRRDSPGLFFPRNTRRADALDSREMGDGEEYLNGPSHSNKFHELRGGDGSMDDRRKFIERRGPIRSFRPNFNNDNENFRFHMNDGPRPFRFCPDADTEFERSNGREREFDGRAKHPSLAVPRRMRNMEEQQDGNFRPPVERVWHDDGFTEARVKRRRF